MNLVVSAIVMCLVLMAAPASAEWYADVYAGQSLTLSDDVTVHRPAGLGIYRDVEFDQSLLFGGRFGRYLDRVPFLGPGPRRLQVHADDRAAAVPGRRVCPVGRV